jgi:hypothetical protein
MDEQFDGMFMDDPSEFSFRFGEPDRSSASLAQPSDDFDELRFLEEMKARDQDFLSIMRQYDHLLFTNGTQEARIATKELAGGKQTIKKKDIVSIFAHAGGWKIGNLEQAELLRIMGNQTEGDEINTSAFERFLLTTSISKNAPNDAFQPRVPSKFLTVIIDGFPAKTSIAYVNSFCSEYGSIRAVKKLDAGSKHSKQPSHHKFLVKFENERSASQAAQKLQGFSSKRIPGPLSCQLLPEEDEEDCSVHATAAEAPSASAASGAASAPRSN